MSFLLRNGRSALRVVRREYALLALMALASWLVVAVNFRHDPSVLYRYWDGPMYILVAKTFYGIPASNPITQGYGWAPITFAPHLLMYPLAIRIFAPVFGYAWAMVFLAVAFSAVAAIVFYKMLADFALADEPLWLAVVFLFVPYRWLLYRSVGASEPMFLALAMLSLLLFMKRRYWLSFAVAALACDTRIQGILLAPTYALTLLTTRGIPPRRKLLLLGGSAAVPVLLLLNFGLHWLRLGDPLAYFAVNNGMVDRVPLLSLLRYLKHAELSIGYFGGQLYLLLYGITLIGVARLWGRPNSTVLFIYCLLSFVFLIFVIDEDLARFLLPIAPFTWVLAFKEAWTDKRTMIAFPVLLALTYLYVLYLIPQNLADPRTLRELLHWNP